MKLATVFSRANMGINAPQVSVEAHLSNGLPKFSIVGLAETAVKESKDRVRSAIINSHFNFPNGRITVNLAPADLPKDGGGRFDLAIAVGILLASGQLQCEDINQYEFIGELGLSGEVRPVQGCIASAVHCRKAGRTLILPINNGHEALLADCQHFIADHLLKVCAHLNREESLVSQHNSAQIQQVSLPDIQDIKGQEHAKRTLEIAASGGHSLLMVGPPGTGKTMLASRLPGILPPVNQDQALEIASIYSMSHHGFKYENWLTRPFRSPHHTASAVALVGGGSTPRPGEITLAHLGVLFLDELPEFDRKVLEVLREPLEAGQITISRAALQMKYPARFQLIAAMNPCPCGYLGSEHHECRCRPEQVQRYINKLSGPLLDRIDMHIEVPALSLEFMTDKTQPLSESSHHIQQRVMATHERQYQRQETTNALLKPKQIDQFCELSDDGKNMLLSAAEQFKLSARSFHRILKVARTIADMAGATNIELSHIAEAIGYRPQSSPILNQ